MLTAPCLGNRGQPAYAADDARLWTTLQACWILTGWSLGGR